MNYYSRQIESSISKALERGKSILLLGPRQTGKTTLVEQWLKPDVNISFARVETRLRYEARPSLLAQELQAKYSSSTKKKPLVFIDEIQKIPLIMDSVQDLIDHKVAQFILTGSSARKLKYGTQVNLLPGRVVSLTIDSFNYQELPTPKSSLEELLLYGSLPNIIQQQSSEAKKIDLHSYVTTYLEEEIRAEALVRNVGAFTRFLELAASEAGQVINFTKLSQNIGISDSTIASYYQILEDCLIVSRIDPVIKSITHRRLIKSPKYLFFDLGVRRVCANEGVKLPERLLAHLFEQFVGIELLRYARLSIQQPKLRYWRDTAGPEIDFVLDIEKQFIPIEVKWSNSPSKKDARHIKKFLDEYDNAKEGYIVCRTPTRFQIAPNITAIPWKEIGTIINS